MSDVEIHHGGLESWDEKEKEIDFWHHVSLRNLIKVRAFPRSRWYAPLSLVVSNRRLE
jgi:uncharacterized protein (DUF488 family)